MNHALHRERIHKLRYRILALAGATLVTGGALTWGLYETGLLTQEIQKTPEDILVEKLLQEPEIEHFNRASREFHDYYSVTAQDSCDMRDRLLRYFATCG